MPESKLPPRERVFSGMRPTGRLHLGHLLGALPNWVKLQDDYDCVYCVADLHALTTRYDSVAGMKKDTVEMVADWIAVGIDPGRSIIFRQSEVKAHSELALLLGMLVPVSWLTRVPSYKEMVSELGERVATFGFLGYPVLQTADIILYKAGRVPVGEDQLSHLELAREIVRRFNGMYGDIFPEPKAILTETPRLLGLDGRKMSKSYGNTIDIAEDPESVRKKVMAMFTDPARQRLKDPGHPDRCNVFSYHKFFEAPAAEIDQIDRGCRAATIGCTECKGRLADRILAVLDPIREKREALLGEPGHIEAILEDGRQRALAIATGVFAEACRAIGI
ncbi:MAG: tryptophan--tRNA ligase [Actinomycetota bacterium]|nr:tryptophan--tRNA ligase [Actinomycetota bacterium]